MIVSQGLQVSEVSFISSEFNYHVWVSVQLCGSNKLLEGCIYHSPSKPIRSSIVSYIFVSYLKY